MASGECKRAAALVCPPGFVAGEPGCERCQSAAQHATRMGEIILASVPEKSAFEFTLPAVQWPPKSLP